MFGRFGWMEILIIVVLVVILFGHAKIPGMMKNLADGINIFKKELKNTKKSSESVVAEKPAAKNVNKKTAAADKKSVAKKSGIKKATAKKAPAKKTVGKK